MISPRTVQSRILGASLVLCAGCTTFSHKRQYGDLTVWYYGFRNPVLLSPKYYKSEFPDVHLDSKSPQFFVIEDTGEFPDGFKPTQLLFPVPNPDEFIDPRALEVQPLQAVNVELKRFSHVVLSVQAFRDGNKLDETTVDFSKGNWYFIVADSHRAFATKPTLMEPLSSGLYDTVRIEVLQAPKVPGLRARLVSPGDAFSTFVAMKAKDNGVDHVLYKIRDDYLPGRTRPRTWPLRW